MCIKVLLMRVEHKIYNKYEEEEKKLQCKNTSTVSSTHAGKCIRQALRHLQFRKNLPVNQLAISFRPFFIIATHKNIFNCTSLTLLFHRMACQYSESEGHYGHIPFFFFFLRDTKRCAVRWCVLLKVMSQFKLE